MNQIRRVGCDDRPAASSAVAVVRELDSAARLVASGIELATALEQSGFRARTSSSVNVGGVRTEEAVREVLADGFCDSVNNAAYTAMGTYTRGDEFWLVLAEPFQQSDPGGSRAAADRVLELVNHARSEARRCGARRMPPARALRLSMPLVSAAAAHANDMADRDRMDHRGSDGSNPGERANRHGYEWRAVAENVAAGQRGADAVVQAWLDSPGHCANLMDPRFTEMGVAFALAPASELEVYWAQVFAAPR